MLRTRWTVSPVSAPEIRQTGEGESGRPQRRCPPMGVTHSTSRSAARLALVTNTPPAAANPPSDVPAGLRLLRTLDRSVLEVARDVNLRPMELYALLLLDEHDQKAMTTRRLSEVLASSPSQAKQIALRLAARGYVERGGGHGQHGADAARPGARRAGDRRIARRDRRPRRADRVRRGRPGQPRARLAAARLALAIRRVAGFSREQAGHRHHQLLDARAHVALGDGRRRCRPGLHRGRPPGGRQAADPAGRPALGRRPGRRARRARRHPVRRRRRRRSRGVRLRPPPGDRHPPRAARRGRAGPRPQGRSSATCRCSASAAASS